MTIDATIAYIVFLAGMIGLAITLWLGLRAIKLI